MKNIILTFLFASIMTNCDKCVPDQFYIIRVYNFSESPARACGAYILPDTLLSIKPLATTKILSGKSNVIQGHMIGDDKLERFKKEKVTIFIIDENVFNTIAWDEICKNNMILERYEINEEDLAQMGWSIKYDPR